MGRVESTKWLVAFVLVAPVVASCSGIPAQLNPRTSVARIAPSAPVETLVEDAVAAPEMALAYSPTKHVGTVDRLIAQYAAHYGIPERLVRKVVERESNFNPAARNGPYRGLMQIHPTTARTMGYRGEPDGLMDPETNLKYGVKYLRGAYLVSKGDERRADKLYQSGYYYAAKRMGLLEETGLR